MLTLAGNGGQILTAIAYHCKGDYLNLKEVYK
jgi:hypothetical protein